MVMDIFNVVFSAENIRMLVLLAFGYVAITKLKLSLAKLIDEKIDSKLEAFHVKLKQNDFVHLNNTIEALTFTLEKNKFLSVEDKAYIDSRLDR
jgi:ribosome assembly protein YihI (activator of Der GTPase)